MTKPTFSLVYKNGDKELAVDLNAPEDVTTDEFKRSLLAPALSALQSAINSRS